MKKLLLLGASLLLSVAIQAQPTIDSSNWKEGDDISDAVGFGNRSFESDPMDYWQETHVDGNPTYTGGLAEVYNGHDCDLWQVIYLPAGTYTLECQGYYRNGTSWDEDPNTWSNGSWVNRAKLYAETGLYDIDSEEFVSSGSPFEGWLMPRLFEGVMERLFEDTDYTLNEDGSKKFAAGWDMSDGQYNQADGRWGPCSIPGSLVWFESGKYEPYDDGGEVQYNTVTFFVTEDSWVKLGVKKTESKSADSFMATNFRLIYVGDASEQVQIKLAMKSLYAAQEKADMLAESIMEEIPALGVLCQDIVMNYEYDEKSLESIQEATERYREMLKQFQTALRDANALRSLITSAETLAETTDYKGKPDFLTAIEAAKLVAFDGEDGSEPSVVESIDAYAAAKAALAEAQVAYIMTQEVKDGYSDYSYVINKPFFVDEVYNPTWDEESQSYKFSDEIEETWMTIQEQDYTSAMNEHSDWIPLLDGFPVTNNESAENCWVMHQTTWHGGGIGDVTLQHGYPAIGGWTAEPSGNPELIYQTITELPNGFYSMSALMCNAGADISPLMYVYIENSEGTRETAPLTQKGSPWWGGNRDQWRQSVWEKLTTGMVQVTDGRVTIGASSDFFYAVTGFQLYYYGENPDFSEMIQQKKATVQANAMNNLTFPGDIAKVNALLDAVVLPVEGFEAYEAANKALNEADEYTNAAYNYLNQWTLVEQILNDQINYAENSPEYTILENYAMEDVLYIGTGDDDTYLTAQEASATYDALKSYFNYRPQVAATAEYNAEITEIIERHNTTLKSETITKELIETLRSELEAAYTKAMTSKNSVLFAELGADKATPSNPVEITALLVNPSFDNGSNGWTGAISVDNNLQNAERFNTTFDFYQTLNTMPRGKYVAKVQSFYRDGGVGNTTSGGYFNWWTAAAGDIELWENKNVEFYAKAGEKEEVSYITSICSEQFTERSMERIFNGVDPNSGEPLLDEDGHYVLDENGKEIWINLDTLWLRYDDESPSWQFDVSVTEEVQPDEFATYYYTNSMAGTAARFAKSPDAYWNEVEIVVEDGENLTIGMRKSKSIENDWCMFDNFRLYYLGTEGLPPTGINSVTGTAVAKKQIFNISGQQLATPQRGLNIINGQKVLIK